MKRQRMDNWSVLGELPVSGNVVAAENHRGKGEDALVLEQKTARKLSQCCCGRS